MEKRVKSRFSHRQIFLHPGDTSGSKTPITPFEDRLQLFEDLLSLPDDENVNEIEQLNKDCLIDANFRATWNAKIKNLVNNPTIVNLLKQMHAKDRTERKFRNFLALVISNLCTNHQELEVEDFVQTSKIFSQDEKILVLEGLSTLEMCLVSNQMHYLINSN